MKSLKNTQTVPIGKKKVTLEKLPIRKILEILQSVNKIPKEIAQLDKGTAEETIEQLPIIIASGIDTFLPIIQKAIDDQLSKDEILDASFEEIIDLVIAFLEVNNVAGILLKLKKASALVQPGGAKK